MKILLTGGAGFIGSHTLIELTEAGHEAVVVDNLDNSSPISLKRVAKIIGKAASRDLQKAPCSHEFFQGIAILFSQPRMSLRVRHYGTKSGPNDIGNKAFCDDRRHEGGEFEQKSPACS